MKRNKVWDVAIIGAGPAGTTAASLLADKGFEVLILDREYFPRAKPCGGALSQKIKKFLLVEYESLKGHEVFGAEFSFKGQDAFRIESPDCIAKLIHREDLDLSLLNLSIDKGARFVAGKKVIHLEKKDSFVCLETENGACCHAKVVIGADGPRGVSARFMNPGHRVPMGVAIEEETEIETIPKLDLKKVYLDFGRFPWGYGWIFPKEGLSSVGCGAIVRRKKIPLKEEFERMKHKFPFLYGNVKKAKGWLLPYFGEFSYHRADEQVLLVGDAARLMDPFLGEGIYYAMASATFAAESIIKMFNRKRSLVGLYLARIQKELMDELKHAVRMAEFVYPRIKLGFYALRRSKSLGHLYVHVMSGKLSYRDFNRELFRVIKAAGRQKIRRLISR